MKMRAICKLGAMKITGFVTEAGGGRYNFNTEERVKAGRMDLVVSATDVKILIK